MIGSESPATNRVLELIKVGRQFGSEPAVHALVDIDLWLERGEWLSRPVSCWARRGRKVPVFTRSGTNGHAPQ